MITANQFLRITDKLFTTIAPVAMALGSPMKKFLSCLLSARGGIRGFNGLSKFKDGQKLWNHGSLLVKHCLNLAGRWYDKPLPLRLCTAYYDVGAGVVNTWIAGTRHGLSLRTASVALSFFANLSDYFNTLSAYAPARQQEMALFKRVVLRCRSTMFALRVASHLCGIAHSVKTLYSKRTELSGEDKVFDVLKIVAKAVFTYVALTRLQRTYQELQKVNTVVDRAYRFGFGSVLEDEPTTDACGLGPLLTKSGFILSEDEWRKGIRQRNTQIRMPRSNT